VLLIESTIQLRGSYLTLKLSVPV